MSVIRRYWKMPEDVIALFVATWEEAESLAEVAAAFNMTPRQARNRAANIRRTNRADLKQFKKRSCYKKEVGE